MIPKKIYIGASAGVVAIASNTRTFDSDIEYIRKDAQINYMGKISMTVNSFSKDFANTFRAEGANKTISLITEYLENL